MKNGRRRAAKFRAFSAAAQMNGKLFPVARRCEKARNALRFPFGKFYIFPALIGDSVGMRNEAWRRSVRWRLIRLAARRRDRPRYGEIISVFRSVSEMIIAALHWLALRDLLPIRHSVSARNHHSTAARRPRLAYCSLRGL